MGKSVKERVAESRKRKKLEELGKRQQQRERRNKRRRQRRAEERIKRQEKHLNVGPQKPLSQDVSHPLRNRQVGDGHRDNVLFLGGMFTDITNRAMGQGMGFEQAKVLRRALTPAAIAWDLAQNKRPIMQEVRGRDLARALSMEQDYGVNVYTANRENDSQLRMDRHIGGDWNVKASRGLAGKIRQMNVDFQLVFLDYMYLPGGTYQAEYIQDGFFDSTLVAIKERLAHCTGKDARKPAIFLPATNHILATLCRSAKTFKDGAFAISLLDEKQGREENLLYKATVEMKCSNDLFQEAFCGKSMNDITRCDYDEIVNSLLRGDAAAKRRLESICMPLTVKDAVGNASFIKIERKVALDIGVVNN